ncbi:DUF1203 domain-containing protein [Arenimonas fontis]|uniref:DUF1203 domain-containing protein n=1 Tax=Arenimonas fontis TaxID=2608255 RepID=A0A5B2Z981_9GAMM|nr:DUF1203 domain-containing protein [Arenimonas fontis]KAA2285268.1 DUF1203 domain-containing protein [Arenimonas fontis]
MKIRIRGLSPEPFRALLDAPRDRPPAPRAVWRTVNAMPGFPCRISLADAEPGETVLLTNYLHQPADTPFQASHAIYLRPGAARWDSLDELPPVFLNRPTLALRAFDRKGWLRGAVLTANTDLLDTARELLSEPKVAYLHAHYPALGCYAAWVGRADEDDQAA